MENCISPINSELPVPDEHEIHIIQNYLTEAQCQQILEMAQSHEAVKTTIGNIGEGGVIKRTKTSGFIADRIDMPKGSNLYKTGKKICTDIYKKIVPAKYGIQIKSYEEPHILRYMVGGTYGIHSDSHNFNPATNSWVKVMNRDYSSVLYLNAEFTGGKLSFPELNMRVTPSKGMLVIFPSNDRYMHSAEPTLSGVRYAFVTWASQKGVKGVPGAPRGKVIRLK